jgi:hypothetical protein
MNYRKLEIATAAASYLPICEKQTLYLIEKDHVILGREGCQPSNSICLLTWEEQETIANGNGEALTAYDHIRNILYGIDLFAIAYKFTPSPDGLKYVCETEDSFDDECAISYWDRTEAEAAAKDLGKDYFVAII